MRLNLVSFFHIDIVCINVSTYRTLVEGRVILCMSYFYHYPYNTVQVLQINLSNHSDNFFIIASTASWTFSGADFLSECQAGFILSCSIYRPTRAPFCTVSQCFFSSISYDVQIFPLSTLPSSLLVLIVLLSVSLLVLLLLVSLLGNVRANVPSFMYWILDISTPDLARNSDWFDCKCSKMIWLRGCTYCCSWVDGVALSVAENSRCWAERRVLAVDLVARLQRDVRAATPLGLVRLRSNVRAAVII